MHLISDSQEGDDSGWVQELQNMFPCFLCHRIFLPTELFECEICSHFICDSCHKVEGKWVHIQQTCLHCTAESTGAHILNCVCSPLCEETLNHLYLV